MPKFTHVVIKGSSGANTTGSPLAFDAFVESAEAGLARCKNYTDRESGGDANFDLAFVVPIAAYAGIDGDEVYASDKTAAK